MAVLPHHDHEVEDGAIPIIKLGEIEVDERKKVHFVRTDAHCDPTEIAFSLTAGQGEPELPDNFSTVGVTKNTVGVPILATRPGTGSATIEVTCNVPGKEFLSVYEASFTGVNDETRAAAAAERERSEAAERRGQEVERRQAEAAAAGNAGNAAVQQAPAPWHQTALIAIVILAILGTMVLLGRWSYGCATAPVDAILAAGTSTSQDAKTPVLHVSDEDSLEAGPNGESVVRHGCCDNKSNPTQPTTIAPNPSPTPTPTPAPQAQPSAATPTIPTGI